MINTTLAPTIYWTSACMTEFVPGTPFTYFSVFSYNTRSVCMLSHFRCVRLFVISWTVAHRLLCAWDFPGKNTGLGCRSLLQGLFLIQGLNPCISMSSAFAGRFFTSATWEVLIAPCYYIYPYEPQNINSDPEKWWDWKVLQGSTTNHLYMLRFESRFPSQNCLPLCWTPFACAKLYPTVNIMFFMLWSASESCSTSSSTMNSIHIHMEIIHPHLPVIQLVYAYFLSKYINRPVFTLKSLLA